MLDRTRPVIVKLLVRVSANVASREDLFEVLEELGIDGHDIFEMTMHRAILDHQNLPVSLDDLRLEFAYALIAENLDRQLAIQNLLAYLGHAAWAERVGCPRPSEGRLGLFVRLEQWLVGPFRGERRIRPDAIHSLENSPGCLGCNGQTLFNILDWLVHSDDSYEWDRWKRRFPLHLLISGCRKIRPYP
jgi:antitoxin component of RelBE/YafQ-DinJ toxin-antitoxin module